MLTRVSRISGIQVKSGLFLEEEKKKKVGSIKNFQEGCSEPQQWVNKTENECHPSVGGISVRPG